MRFNADSSAAKKEIESLQNALSKLVMSSGTSNIGKGIADDMREATRATAELSVHLKKAINTETGNLDFSKLTQSIKQSGKTL